MEKMAETGKVRIVRCPKCENFLPEVTNFSVYQCGGCGAVLRAKNKGVDSDTFSEKLDEKRVASTLENLSDRYENVNVAETRMTDLSEGSGTDARSTISSSIRAERRVLHGRGGNDSPCSDLVNNEGNSIIDTDDVQDKDLQQGKISHDFEDGGIWNDNETLQKSEAEVMYFKEGPSNHHPMAGCSYGNPMVHGGDGDVFNNIDYTGHDRAAILKQLDEIKDKLSRSGNLIEEGKGKVGMTRHMEHQDPYASVSQYPDSSLRYSYADERIQRPYQSWDMEQPSLMHREEVDRSMYYPPRYAPRHVPVYDDSSRSHMLNGGRQLPTRVYNSRPYIVDGSFYTDNMEHYPPKVGRHHPSCSCYQCRSGRQATPSTQPNVYIDKYSDISTDAMYTSAGSFGSRDYIRRIPDPALRSRNLNLHRRWPSDLSDVTSEVDGFIRRLPPQRQRVISSGRHYRPLSGGAPFFTCCNCFELLLFPVKIRTNLKKLRCSSCSTVIACKISDKSLVFSIDVDPKDTHVKLDDMGNLHSTQVNGAPNQGKTMFSSIDYDNSGYDFHSMDQESQNNSIEVRSGQSDMEENWSNQSRAPKGLQNHLVNHPGEGNRSGRTEDEKEFLSKTTARQISRKESSATEIDLSSNEYGNTGSTFDSGGEKSRGEQLKGRRGIDSFFAGFIKKSHKDLNKHEHDVEEEKANVTVNGHLIPDRLIKKAEKLAGPIHPGNYWYDFRAGFWGAIGGPCLGIIPPFIEEFNYPMQEKCGGGNTHVFVNGRELNQKDLNLLSSRGLPSESNRSYIIEISGRVLDEDTSEELEGLGKLAPTVEKAKRGFGMRDPTVVAR